MINIQDLEKRRFEVLVYMPNFDITSFCYVEFGWDYYEEDIYSKYSKEELKNTFLLLVTL